MGQPARKETGRKSINCGSENVTLLVISTPLSSISKCFTNIHTLTSDTGKPVVSVFSVVGPHPLRKGGVTSPLPKEDGVGHYRNTGMGSDIAFLLVKAEITVLKPV